MARLEKDCDEQSIVLDRLVVVANCCTNASSSLRAIRKMNVFHLNVCTIFYIFIFLFCQKLKAVDNILNYFSNNNNMIFELTNYF